MTIFRRRTLIRSIIGAAVIAGLTVGSAVAFSAPSSPPTTIGASGGPPVTPPSGGTNYQSTTPIHEGPPSVVAATVACNPSDVIATWGALGPYNGNPSEWQVIIDLSSKTDCFVSGYPTVALTTASGTVAPSTTVNGDTVGAVQPIADVTLNPSTTASFLIQGSEYLVANDSCPAVNGISFTIPNSDTSIDVNMQSTGLEACGTLKVTPFIQGNSADRYFQ
jgi:hypothetical protein